MTLCCVRRLATVIKGSVAYWIISVQHSGQWTWRHVNIIIVQKKEIWTFTFLWSAIPSEEDPAIQLKALKQLMVPEHHLSKVWTCMSHHVMNWTGSMSYFHPYMKRKLSMTGPWTHRMSVMKLPAQLFRRFVSSVWVRSFSQTLQHQLQPQQRPMQPQQHPAARVCAAGEVDHTRF